MLDRGSVGSAALLVGSTSGDSSFFRKVVVLSRSSRGWRECGVLIKKRGQPPRLLRCPPVAAFSWGTRAYSDRNERSSPKPSIRIDTSSGSLMADVP